MAEKALTLESETDYVYVEMVLNKESKYDVVAGLFKGILTRGKDVFVLLNGIEGTTNFLSLDFYNIMSIEELSDDYKNFSFCSASQEDQETGFEILEGLYYKLINNGGGLESDPTVIDISKYSNVDPDLAKSSYGKPHEINTFNTVEADNKRTVYKNDAGKYTTIKPQTTKTTTTTTYVKPTPTVMERDITQETLPSEELLILLREKLDKVLDDDYIVDMPPNMGEYEDDDMEEEEDDDNEIIEIDFDLEEEEGEETVNNAVGAATIDPKSISLFDKEDLENMGVMATQAKMFNQGD